MKLVFLDAKTIGSDINLSAFETLGEVVYYDFTTPDEASIRSRDADVLWRCFISSKGCLCSV